MENKLTHIACLIILIIGLFSCVNETNNRSQKRAQNPTVQIIDDTVIIKCNSSQLLTIKVLDHNIYSNNITAGIWKSSLLSVVKDSYNDEDKWALPLYMTKHNNMLPIHINVSNIVDTIVPVKIQPLIQVDNHTTIKGECAKLVSINNNPDLFPDAKKWLFRTNEYLPDSLISNMVGIYKQLNKNEFDNLFTNSKIPVLKSFSGKTYTVTSNIKADHYVLYACSSQNDINGFVEEIVSNDFELTVPTLNKPLNCYRELNSNGIKCITLICLNNDWSYQIVPLGLVAIDNIAPTKKKTQTSEIKSINLNNQYQIDLQSGIPEVFGFANVIVTNWDGNGIKCNVSFSIYHGGDTKYVTIVREYAPGRYESYYPKPEKKKILVENKENPYFFTYDIHLTDGDNIIPIIVEDNHGNTAQYNIVIPAEFEYRNTNSINIDNNIDIYN